jgi:hypothetical protein
MRRYLSSLAALTFWPSVICIAIGAWRVRSSERSDLT